MKRVLTAAIGIPVVLLATVYAPGWLFASILAAVTALALEEFLRLAVDCGIARPGRWFLLFGAVVTASFQWGGDSVVIAAAVAAMTLMTAVVFGGPIQSGLGKIVAGLAGVIYCCLLLGFVLMLSRASVIMLFAIVWVGDSAAYYGGRAIGRHLLAPAVSPKKTVEGAIAGLIGSIVAGVVAAAWLTGHAWPEAALFSGLTAIAGQIGDLAESVLKRSAGVKDSSSVLPGHGGILDRLDSLFFAAPVLYCLLQVM